MPKKKQLDAIPQTTTQSGLRLAEKQKQLAIARRKEIVQIWAKHFSQDLKINERMPISQVTMQNAIAEPRLFQLKHSDSRQNVMLVIVSAVKDLSDFVSGKKLTNTQILDTAELIYENMDGLSLMAIIDCFNMIKAGKAPFDRELYHGLDGRKILKWLQ